MSGYFEETGDLRGCMVALGLGFDFELPAPRLPAPKLLFDSFSSAPTRGDCITLLLLEKALSFRGDFLLCEPRSSFLFDFDFLSECLNVF